jgi:hypothetical protein
MGSLGTDLARARHTEDDDIGAVELIPTGACWLESERC